MTYYASADLARAFRTVRKNTIQLAQEIPEAEYQFRPAPDSRTVAEMLAHMASQTSWVRQMHGVDRKSFVSFEDFQHYMKEVKTNETSLAARPKDEILAALASEGETFAAWVGELPDTALAETVGFPSPIDPPQKTRFEMLLGAKEHEMHHRGQLMVIQRMLGLVPHLTRARQQRG
ncbi:MAG: DinB family protein [Vicinamibacterales bacterium]